MGKHIDRIVLLLLFTTGTYILFAQTFGSVTAACCATVLCAALVRRISGFRHPASMTASQARMLLQQWAFLPDDEAKSKIALLLKQPDDRLIYLPRHPSAAISVGDVLSAWKTHRKTGRIVIASVCYADARAKAFARSLNAPAVEILDQGKLIPLLRKSGFRPPEAPKGLTSLSRIAASIRSLPDRRPWHRTALPGAGMFILYLFSGNPLYLAGSMVTLFIAGAAFKRSRL